MVASILLPRCSESAHTLFGPHDHDLELFPQGWWGLEHLGLALLRYRLQGLLCLARGGLHFKGGLVGEILARAYQLHLLDHGLALLDDLLAFC